MTDADIAAVAETVERFREGKLHAQKGFCAAASTGEIAKQDYILTPGRYVGIAEETGDGEPFDEKMARLTSELSGLFVESRKLEKEIRKRLGAIGYEI
jgi:type I restriction enzyme M protein